MNLPTKKRGRPVGAKNKRTKELKEMINRFLVDNFDEAMRCWNAIQSPHKKAALYVDLVPFMVAKQSAMTLDATLARVADNDDEFKQLTQQLINATLQRKPTRAIQLPQVQTRKDGDAEGFAEWHEVNK